MRWSWLPSIFLFACTQKVAAPPPLASLCGDMEAFSAAAGSSGATKPEERASLFLQHCGLEETIALTAELVRFPTVSSKESPAEGPAFAGMAAHLESWAKRTGMRFERHGKNDVWEIHLGEGEPLIAFVMHADVVPAEEGEWKTPPFEATRQEGRLHGRGTEDDKGPIAAVLVMMHALRRFGVELPGRISAVMGTGEEHDWTGMIAYAKERPHAQYVISLDSSYPVVVAESGFVSWVLSAPRKGNEKKRGCAEPVAAEIGQFLTLVPGEARMTIAGADKARLEAAIAKTDKEQFELEVKENGSGLELIARGEAIHSSQADEGRNAFWALARVASRLDLCDGGVATMMKLVADKLDGDHWGEKLGLGYQDPMMGRLLVAPTMLRSDGDRVLLSVNMRRPAGKTAKEFEAELDRAAARLKEEISPDIVQVADERYVGEPAVSDRESTLTKTLLEIYREATGDATAQPISIRGGTYARLFPGAVTFGPALPGRPYRGHAPDEYVELDALALMNRTTMEAVRRLSATATRR